MEKKKQQPHVVMVPFPLQGHVKPLLCLAQLLSEAGLYVSFVNTTQSHQRFTNLETLTTHFPNLHFECISDGLPEDHPRALLIDYFEGMKKETTPHFKDLLLSLGRKSLTGSSSPPVTCIIADGVLPFAVGVAEELGIPIFSFCVHSARFLWGYLNIPKLSEDGQLPFSDGNLYQSINGIPGLEGIFRRKDLPEFCILPDPHHPIINFFVGETVAMTKTSGLILNTFDELEDSCIHHVSSSCNNLYTVGPLHAHINSKIGDRAQLVASHGSLYNVEKNCLKWLDSQPSKSVLYVSFGSITQTSLSQLMEFWHGLINSGQPFLWVIRPGAIIGEQGDEGIPEQLLPGHKERGYIVEWAPQEQVLAHHALGAFLTHSGWGSVLESIVAKIPMICWPYMGDHYINTQCVTKVWKIGVELEAWDRSTVENAIKALMETKKEDFQKSTDKVAKLAEDSISKGGSSSQNLEKLVEDIKKIKAAS